MALCPVLSFECYLFPDKLYHLVGNKSLSSTLAYVVLSRVVWRPLEFPCQGEKLQEGKKNTFLEAECSPPSTTPRDQSEQTTSKLLPCCPDGVIPFMREGTH